MKGLFEAFGLLSESQNNFSLKETNIYLTQKSQNTLKLTDTAFSHAEIAEPARPKLGVASRHCEERSNPQKPCCLDCFVVPPRNDAKRVGAKRQQIHIVQRIMRGKTIPPKPSAWPRPISRNTCLAAIPWFPLRRFRGLRWSAQGSS